MGSPRPVVVVLVVLTFVEAVCDVQFLALRGVVVWLVGALVVPWAAVPLTAGPGVLAVMPTAWVGWRQCCGR